MSKRSENITKNTLVLLSVPVITFGVLLSPFIYYHFKDSARERAILNRSDFPQIAQTCLDLRNSITNDRGLIRSNDSRFPPILASLSARDISLLTNCVIVNFGGMSRMSYWLRQNDDELKTWTLSYRADGIDKQLVTVTNR